MRWCVCVRAIANLLLATDARRDSLQSFPFTVAHAARSRLIHVKWISLKDRLRDSLATTQFLYTNTTKQSYDVNSTSLFTSVPLCHRSNSYSNTQISIYWNHPCVLCSEGLLLCVKTSLSPQWWICPAIAQTNITEQTSHYAYYVWIWRPFVQILVFRSNTQHASANAWKVMYFQVQKCVFVCMR